MPSLADVITNGGPSWVDLATTALDRLPDCDSRVRSEILAADSYITRLWFFLSLLYILHIDIPTTDPYFLYLLQHGYRFLYHVFYSTGDIFRYMYVLHARMVEYRDMPCMRRVE